MPPGSRRLTLVLPGPQPKRIRRSLRSACSTGRAKPLARSARETLDSFFGTFEKLFSERVATDELRRSFLA